jgi:anti-sigma regulatory factor (Ser/Thr protein kinase)
MASSPWAAYARVVEAAAGVGTSVMVSTTAWVEQSLDALAALDGVHRAGIAVAEGGGRRLHFTSAEQPGVRPVTWCRIDAYDDVPLNTAIRSGRAIVGTISEMRGSHPAFVERQAGTGTTALAAIPLVAAGRTLGGFVLFYRDEVPLHDEGVRELVVLGARLGEGLERSRAPRSDRITAWMCEPAPGALVAQWAIEDRAPAVGRARRDVRATLAGWGVAQDVAETVALCLSELVTNALVHAASGCAVRVFNDDGALTVEVRNPGPAPVLTGPDAYDPLPVHGRGLQLVDALTSRWGASRDGDGYSAWFVLEE